MYVFSLIYRRSLAGSLIEDCQKTQEMLITGAEHGSHQKLK
jgi:hypothetical protein